MVRPNGEHLRRLRRWFVPVALAVVAPKCLLCLAAYTGLGVALGLPLSRPELCGGEGASVSPHLVVAAALGSGALLAGWMIRRRRSSSR